MNFEIHFIFDEEENVWTAYSDEVGVVLEDEDLENLIKRLSVAVPELMGLNLEVIEWEE